MIFQHTFDWVINQSPNTKLPKTQTSRLAKVGEVAFCDDHNDNVIVCVISATGRIKWEVGKTYAIQRGRGISSEKRFKLLEIRREDRRNINNEDVRAEGFSHARDFLHVWLSMHDPTLERRGWGEKALMECPAKFYDAWVLTFEVVQ